ncbi:calcium-binding protein [Nocardioides sp. YIM 152315]|uniref:calcium-binding protein n=1 Tax=Nocardioides sp. YIM 152315 TaxID=3031760 RepID=UPI0023D9E5C0|nr:calcium-binding protein [Nocardioides sp. YIM 152315]MDF1603942.1 calcium-binding protein [Nocardioides sp. YIM 152315]
MRRLPVLGVLVGAVSTALAAVPGPADAAAPSCQGHRATIVGTDRGDVLTGTPGRDVIVGRGGDDEIRGGGGSDLLCGGPGEDRLYGGADRRWHDQFQTIATGDRLDGGPGDDLLHPGPTIRGVELVEPDLLVFGGTRGVDVDLGARRATGQGTDRIVWRRTLGVRGSDGDDRIVGTGGPDHLTGRGGDDELIGRGGRDTLRADVGDDLVRGGRGSDDLTSTGGRDELHGGRADDVISVRGGRGDEVRGDGGGDLVFVYVGDDLRNLAGAVIDGGPPGPEAWDTNAVWVSSGAPMPGVRVAVDARAGTITGGTMTGFAQVGFGIRRAVLDFLGSDGPDELTTDFGRVVADGRGGDDLLSGGPRNDRLVGGGGTDHVFGQAGTDTCDAEHVKGCERPSKLR